MGTTSLSSMWSLISQQASAGGWAELHRAAGSMQGLLLRRKLTTGTVSLLLHSRDQSKAEGWCKFNGRKNTFHLLMGEAQSHVAKDMI